MSKSHVPDRHQQEPLWAAMKASYDAWEQAATPLLDAWLRSPMFLRPAGTMLTGITRVRAMQRKVMDHWWASVGLSTRKDQERTLHGIDELQSRLVDLETRLADLEGGR
ncbi:MAG: hypothetical protein CMN30_25590 [Sandaracinus sp.]|nr:hypothetical protein [Sandaracinus sp.]|tara:strand:- start:1028 stop:1354 length:327 start_codon:yes stop_codon:yes gene_type:complete